MSDKEYQPWERNELNKNSKGGTELTMEGIISHVDPELLFDFQLIAARVRDLHKDKIRIYHLHDLPEDPEASHLKNSSSRDRFHKLVFSSNWQYNRYCDVLGIPRNDLSAIIETAIEPIDIKTINKSKDEVRLIYTSTPHRGLELLVPVFIELCKKHDNITLDVFSSFKIYGWQDADKPYEELFKICREHPKINYHGFAKSNTDVREALAKAHILAYPCIWQETSCRSVIEAMSAGLLCVHPNYAALSDTAGGMNFMYQWNEDRTAHANRFFHSLDHAITNVNSDDMQNYLKLVKIYADSRFNMSKNTSIWTNLLMELKDRFPTVESRKMPGLMFTYEAGR